MSFDVLLEKARQYLPPEKVAVVEKAYRFALKAHEGQMRLSGEPYLEHPLQVAITLAGLQLDADALAAALLHDVTEDAGVPITGIQEEFSPQIARLVDGTTKLGRLSLQVPGSVMRRDVSAARQQQAESLRKMLVAMAEDLRVVFIKLADRLHNMRTLDALPPERQREISRETLEIYAPLAHRLGIWELKWQLEDLAFRYLEPRKYNHLASLVAARRGQREDFIARVMEILKKEFEKAGLPAEITGRPKHLYGVHQKMQRYEAQGKQFNEIYDLLAVRVIVNTIPECYEAVGIVHNLWHPLPGAFDDYIANPKTNGYRALHTVVMSLGTTPLEIQVRTQEMHHIAEYGVAAHWRYKEGGKEDPHFEERIGWLRQLIDWHRELSGAEEFLESVKTDIFIDQVFVFTPKGEIKDLPKGATPLDFAYRVHTELGHHCVGAKVNGKLVPLDYQLANGDVVEIMTTRREKGPTRDWLNPHLGYVKTSHARQKIRQWFKKQQRSENIERGRELLEKELKQLGLKTPNRDALAKSFDYTNADDFLAAIGYGGLSVHHIALKLAAQEEQPRPIPSVAPAQAPTSTSAVRVLGAGEMLTNLGRCCHPVPGDEIIGYITRGRGVTIHRKDCYSILREDEKERLINVEWGHADALYPVALQVEAYDRVGLARDITTVVAEEKVNIASMTVNEHEDRTTTVCLTLETKGITQLGRLMGKMEAIKGVSSVSRIGMASAKPTQAG